MWLGCVSLILLLTFATTNASKYTQEESNEDKRSTFNIVSTLSGGTESSRHHVKTNLDLEPSYPYLSATQKPFGNAVVAPHNHHHHHHNHNHNHNHAVGEPCSHTTGLTHIGGVGNYDVSGNIDNPHGHERSVDPVSGAGLLDVRNGVGGNARPATSGYQARSRPITYPESSPGYPAPHGSYPTSYHPSYPVPLNGNNYPSYPSSGQSGSYYPSYPAPVNGAQPPPSAYHQSGVHDHANHPAGPYNNGYGYGNGGPRDHWDHTFKMSTEYKEDGVHKGPTHVLSNNGHGFGSGYGGGYNGAFNRPGF